MISPYSTCLALGIEPVEALKNLKRMAKMGWMGAYGFYEAADYQESTKTPKLVKEWMAHHQGMSLLAVLESAIRQHRAGLVPRQCASGGDAVVAA